MSNISRLLFLMLAFFLAAIPCFCQDLDDMIKKAKQQPKSGPYYEINLPTDKGGKSYTEDQVHKYCKKNGLVIGNMETKEVLEFGAQKNIVSSFQFRPANSEETGGGTGGGIGGRLPEEESDHAFDPTDMAIAEEFEDNRNNWTITSNDYSGEIKNGKVRFATTGYNKGGPSLRLKEDDLHSFEAECRIKAEDGNALHGLLLDDQGYYQMVFGMNKGKPYFALRTTFFGASEDDLSNQLKPAEYNIGGYNKFAIHRLGETVELFINGTSVLQGTLESRQFNNLKGVMFVSGKKGMPVTADYFRLRKKYVNLQITDIKVLSSGGQNKIAFNEKAKVVFTVKNNGNYVMRNQRFELIPGDRKRDKILIDYAVDSVEVIEPGKAFEVAFDVSPGLTLPSDSIVFRLCTPMNGDWERIRTAVATQSYFDMVVPKLPAVSDARQKAINQHYGSPGINIRECVKSINAFPSSDALAIAWKGWLTYLGQGGFQKQEDLGKILMKQNLPGLQAAAQKGEVEAAYLLGNAYLLELGNKDEFDFAPQLIAYAAQQNYPPAMLDYGMYLNGLKEYDKAKQFLQKASDVGYKKALTFLGGMAESGLGGAPDFQLAIKLYNQAAAAGDPDAMVRLANLYLTGTNVPPNADEAVRWATKAAGLGHSGAMLFLAKLYFDGAKGKPKDKNASFQWFTKAANEEDREAMLLFGLLYLEGSLAGGVDEKKALYWIKKAAEAGQPNAMNILGGFYFKGKIAEVNPVKARYWLNKAAMNGVGEGATKAEITHPMAAILDHTTFDTHIIEVTTYADGTTETKDLGVDYMGDFFVGIFDAWMASRSAPMQAQINGLEFIQKLNNVNIYAGTVASRFVSNVQLKAGSEISVEADGEIQAGFVTFCGPNGHADDLVQGWNYSDARHLLHAALIYKIGNNPWELMGRSKHFKATQTGILEIAINDRDYSNNKGYFDFVMEIKE